MKQFSPVQAGAAICGISAIVVAFWFSFDENDKQIATELSIQNNKQIQTASDTNLSKQTPSQFPGITKSQEGMDFAPEMKQRLLTISEAYEEKIRFPSFSQPIKAGELESKYKPDIAIANEQPARLTNPNSPTLSIKASKMRYFSGDHISAIASIGGLDSDEVSNVSATLVANGEIVAFGSATPVANELHSYQIEFNPLQSETLNGEKELTLNTEFQFAGQRYQRGTSIEYIQTIGSIDNVASASIEGSFLSIPVYISTEKPGYHRIKANLYDEQSGQALVHLRAEDIINGNAGELVFQAHIAALKESGSEGPYKLADLSLERLPSEPDYITEFGRVDQENFHIGNYSFSEYQDEPYINEKAQRIAKELRHIGS